MIRVYYLEVQTIDGARQVAGCELIHDSLLQSTIELDLNKLTMDTTEAEHDALIALASSWDAATKIEIALYNEKVTICPPDPDIARAMELLSSSPDVISMPAIWELLRIIGRRFGWCD